LSFLWSQFVCLGNQDDISQPDVDGYICWSCRRKVLIPSDDPAMLKELHYDKEYTVEQLPNGEFDENDFNLGEGKNLKE